MTDRNPPHDLTDERATLVLYLDYLRDAVIRKIDGLSEANARRPMVQSGTSLFGLVEHLTDVDRYWFHHVLGGLELDRRSPAPRTSDCVERYRDTTRTSNQIVMSFGDVEDTSTRETFDGRRPTLRWILVHMIEETGRHAGHADIVRELIDGVVGR
jgi:uncharacterized damage-inducible protein DinB